MYILNVYNTNGVASNTGKISSCIFDGELYPLL